MRHSHCGPRGVLETHTRRTDVSARLIIVNTTLHACLSCPSGNSYGKYLEGPHNAPRPQSPHVCNLYDWISFDGTSPRLRSTLRPLMLVGFCIPDPHVLIRGRIPLWPCYTRGILSRQGPTDNTLLIENGALTALDLICLQ